MLRHLTQNLEIAELPPEEGQESERKVRFYSPSDCEKWIIPEGHHLVGDHHIVRGEFFVIGGTQGVGKSRAVTYLAACGATGGDWFGRPVHHKFRTLVIQNENGLLRLKEELSAVRRDTARDLDEWIRITAPPDDGLRFSDSAFRDEVREEIAKFKPGVVVIDPCNAVASDDQQKDYLNAFKSIAAACPAGDDKPAIGIVAHLRKPGANDKRGRAGMHRLSGSYALASRPRCVFIMDAASNDASDDRVVWACCKNNNGKLGEQSAWYRSDGVFRPCPDFDWEAFNAEGESTMGRPKKGSAAGVAALLPAEGLSSTEWQNLANSALGISKSTFQRRLHECIAEDLVHKSAVTEKYQPIKQGVKSQNP